MRLCDNSNLKRDLLLKRLCRIVLLWGMILTKLGAQTAWGQSVPASFPAPDISGAGGITKFPMTMPDKAEKAMARAREHYLQGHFESAQRDIHQALAACPHCGLAFTFQGVLDLQLGKKKDAARAFEKAIEQDPNPGSAYLGLGIIYNTQHRFTEAIVAFDCAAQFLPDSWLLHFESALAHLSAGQTAGGLKEIEYAGQLTGTAPERQSALAYLRGIAQVELRDYTAAKSAFDEAAMLDPMGNYSALAKKRLEELRPSTSMIP